MSTVLKNKTGEDKEEKDVVTSDKYKSTKVHLSLKSETTFQVSSLSEKLCVNLLRSWKRKQRNFALRSEVPLIH